MRNLQKLFIFVYMISLTLFLFSASNASSGTGRCEAPYEESLAVFRNSPTLISVYRTETGTVTTLPFETYIACVVASEIPGYFHTEAIKAQAVAARTYAAARLQASQQSGCPKAHPLAPLCDTTHCQVYHDTAELKAKSTWNKMTNAVESTESQMLYYNNQLVKHALFHASSGGETENSEDVFVSAVPYLKSVASPYESEYPRNGHGVGMSQQGANGMANAGYSYKEILSHYYTGTSVY